MEKKGIQTMNWHRKYKPIPNIKSNAPCIKICLSNGTVTSLDMIPKELGAQLRKYGTNQGSYPCMNLTPLYRVTDEKEKEEISAIIRGVRDLDNVERIHSWCTENNWTPNFLKKYRISMEQTPKEMKELLKDNEYSPLQILMEETGCFAENPSFFHRELEKKAFQMLERKEKVSLALTVLFHLGNAQKNAKDDTGSLSIALESQILLDEGTPAVSMLFTEKLNSRLIQAEGKKQEMPTELTDAFGIEFAPLEEPMPEVKLAGGFAVQLRTMFKEQHCQMRYRNIENASYPISPAMRKNLQAALNWVGAREQEEITWINIDKNEILFAYPYHLPDKSISFTRSIKRIRNDERSFKSQAEQFLKELKESREPGTDSRADYINYFILRKVDKARTKVVYTYQANAYEMELCAEEWNVGCQNNLPLFPFGAVYVPFPIDVADILNNNWKQDGTLVSNKYKPIPQYHGMELLFRQDIKIYRDLHLLVQNGEQLATYLGRSNIDHKDVPILWKVKGMLALMGLLLYRTGIRKEYYMEGMPYLYGQLLKISDELHAMYCYAVRDGNLPAQLVGGSLFRGASDAPVRTLQVLGQRMAPYIIWAKSYQSKKETKEKAESWRAGWLLALYEKTATQLKENWTSTVHFNDEEKAQLFIGYLAAFPKKERKNESTITDDLKEENKHE
jgi:hypothetical protein